MQFRLLLLAIIVNIAIELFASPQDYGRDYSMRENDTSVPVVFIIFIGVILWGGYKLIYSAVSKSNNSALQRTNKITETNNQNITQSGGRQYGVICPECNGKGYKKGKQVYSDEEYCKYCHGYGKEFSATACKYYTDMMTELAQQRIDLEKDKHKDSQFHYSVRLFLAHQIPSKSKQLLDKELANCKSCSHCKGKGTVVCNTFYETDERMNLIQYRKVSCDLCNGVGYILTK